MNEQQTNDEKLNPKAIAALKKELDLATKKAVEYLAGWQRAKADYLNLKKEGEKYQAEILQFANTALVAQILPIFDHLKIAYRHIPAEQQNLDWVKGFTHIKTQFADFLKKLGIEEIKTVGQKFDPVFHEAVSYESQPEFETDIIFEEIKGGYMLQGEVIQPAKVKVTK